jgi:hypothetical protein
VFTFTGTGKDVLIEIIKKKFPQIFVKLKLADYLEIT